MDNFRMTDKESYTEIQVEYILRTFGNTLNGKRKIF